MPKGHPRHTSIDAGHWEHDLYGDDLRAVQGAFILRHCAVVLSELRRGLPRSLREQKEPILRVALPRDSRHSLAADWWTAGRLVRKLGDARRWDRSKRRDFHNDALIAPTGRRHGATVVTANRGDFAPLAAASRISVLLL